MAIFYGCNKVESDSILIYKFDIEYKLLDPIENYLLEASIFGANGDLFIYNYENDKIEKYNKSGDYISDFELPLKEKLYSIGFNDELVIYFQKSRNLLIIDEDFKIINFSKISSISIDKVVFEPYSYYSLSKPIKFKNKILLSIQTPYFGDYSHKIKSREKKFSYSTDAIYYLGEKNIFHKLVGNYPANFVHKYSNDVFPIRIFSRKNRAFYYSFGTSKNIYVYDTLGQKLKTFVLETHLFKEDKITYFDSTKSNDYSFLYNYEIECPKYRDIFLLDNDRKIFRLYLSQQPLIAGDSVNGYFDRKFSLIAFDLNLSKRIGEQIFDGKQFGFNGVLVYKRGIFLINKSKCSNSKNLIYSYFSL